MLQPVTTGNLKQGWKLPLQAYAKLEINIGG